MDIDGMVALFGEMRERVFARRYGFCDPGGTFEKTIESLHYGKTAA